MIRPITLDTKQAGKRSAGKPHAAFERRELETWQKSARASSRPYLRGEGGGNAVLLPDPTGPLTEVSSQNLICSATIF